MIVSIKYFLIVGLSLFLMNSYAETNPLDAFDTHKRISSKVLVSEYTSEDVGVEIEFGRNLASKILGKYPPITDEALNLYVNKVGKLLTRNSSRPELVFKFIVLDTPDVNAFSTPGGYVFITKGALSHVKSESELAGLLAHEIGHIDLRHYVKAVGLYAGKKDGFSNILLGGGSIASTAFNQAIDETMDILFSKGLKSKKDEFASDSYATWLLLNSGYDSIALLRYFKRIETLNANTRKVLSKTHPPIETRMKHLWLMIKRNAIHKQKLPKMEKRFYANVK